MGKKNKMLNDVFIVTVGVRSECVIDSYISNNLYPKVVIRRDDRTEEVDLRLFFQKLKTNSISNEELVYVKKLAKNDSCIAYFRDKLNMNLCSMVRPKDYELTDGHIGSMLGHRTIWEHLQSKTHGFYLICEDDWIPPQNLQVTLSKMNNLKKVDIIYLFHCDRLIKSQNVIREYCDTDKYWGVPNPTFGLQAYILTPLGAKKLLQNCTNEKGEGVMWLCDDLTGLSIQTSDWSKILGQKHEDEASYMRFVKSHQSNFQSFENWQFLNAYGFRKNIGRLMDVDSTTDNWDYGLHNLLVRTLQIGEFKNEE